MGCLDAIPETCRLKGYDYCDGTWDKIAVQHSGEIRIAQGETIITAGAVLAPNRSGGTALGGTVAVDRVIIKVPPICCSGDTTCAFICNSGLYYGVWIGGKAAGYQPVPSSGCVISGVGMFVEPGEQKELFVQTLDEIRVAGVSRSGHCGASGIFGSGWYGGWPVTYLAEVITC